MQEQATGVISTNDGYIIVGEGHSPNPVIGRTLRIIKIDAEGEELWRQEYQKDYESWGSHVAGIIRTSDGHYIFCGEHQDTVDYVWHGLYGKFDENGDTLWMKVDPREQFTSIIGVLEVSDGGYLFTGRARANLSVGVQLYLLRTDIDGNVLWFQTYGNEGYDRGIWSSPTSDGGFLVGGSKEGDTSQGEDGWLFKVDSLGNVEWEKLFGGPFSDWACLIRGVGDGTYIMDHAIDSIYNAPAVTRSYRYLSKLDEEGNLLWSHFYEGDHPWNPETASFRILEDGSIVIVGRVIDKSWGWEQGVWLIKFSPEGQELWSRDYLVVDGDEEDKYALDFTEAHDGGLVLIGRIGDGGDDMMVLKLDSMGCFTSGCDSVATSSETLFGEEGGLVVYPSPFEEAFRLEGLVPFGKDGRVVVRDMLGRVLLDGGLVRGKFMEEVDSSDWGEGLYVVSLFVEGRVLFSRKVLKR